MHKPKAEPRTHIMNKYTYEEHNTYKCIHIYPHYFSLMETIMSFSQQHKEINRGMRCFNQATLHKPNDRRLNASHAKRWNARVSEGKTYYKKVYSGWLSNRRVHFFLLLFLFMCVCVCVICVLLGFALCCLVFSFLACVFFFSKKIILHMLILFLASRAEPREEISYNK